MFQIGFPVDAGKKSHYILVHLIRARYHSSTECSTSLVLKTNSGAQFAWERSLELHSQYRFQFTIFPTHARNTDRSPDHLFTDGNSDFAACALALAQNRNPKKLTNAPVVLVSCSYDPSPLEQGLHGVKLYKVTNDNSETSLKSLMNKWEATCESKAKALVLYEDDACLLANATKKKVVALQKDTFYKLMTVNEPAIVACKENDLPLLAQALGLKPNLFSLPGNRKSKKWIGIILLFLLLLSLIGVSLMPDSPSFNFEIWKGVQRDNLKPSDGILFALANQLACHEGIKHAFPVNFEKVGSAATISLWIKPDRIGIGQNFQTLISKGITNYARQNPLSTTLNHMSFGLMLSPNSRLYFSAAVNESPLSSWGHVFQPQIVPGQWQQVVLTISAEKRVKLFIDGKAMEEIQAPQELMTIPSAPGELIRVGHRSDGLFYDSTFFGTIANIAIWDHVLSPMAVARLYMSEK